MTTPSSEGPMGVWRPPARREMRENRVKRVLREGKCAVCIYGVPTADMTEVMGNLGYDAIWIEMEHAPPTLTLRDVAEISRACDLWGMSSICRVPNDPWMITRVLDAGCDGVAVPHVCTKAEAEAVVRAAKYGPIGRRGDYTGRQGIGVSNTREAANKETLVMVFVEEVEGVKNLDEILEVEHIDVIFLGAGDLSQDMGYAGQRYHPEVQAVVDDMIRKCAAAGKAAGVVTNDDDVEEYVEKGARFFHIGWQTWVAKGTAAYMEKVDARMANLP